MNETIISANDKAGLHTLQVISRAERFNKWMYKAFCKQLKGHVLEIGSGIGNISRLVLADNFTITLSDYNTEYCSWLKKEFGGNKNVNGIYQVDLLHKNFTTEYTFLKEKYDSVFLLNVIEHLGDEQTAVQNCKFFLKPGGHLILLAPAFQSLYCNFDKELGHYRRYTKSKMKKLAEHSGMSVTESRYFNFAGIAGWLLFGKILNRRLIGRNEMNTFNSLVPLAKLLDYAVLNKAGLSIILTAKKN